MMQKMTQNRKTATKLLLVQWSRFQNVCIKLEGSTLVTGVNGTGKSTILDAMTYVLTGNTQFNKAAKDRDRTVKGYVRGDTKSNGDTRFLRSGQVISYIAIEFWSPVDSEKFVVGVCIESPDEVSSPTSNWFICRNTEIEDINFAHIEDRRLHVTPKNSLQVKGVRLRASDFMARDRGVAQVLRTLGLRCDVKKYQSKLLKMMAFNPENNIDQFIAECVLEPGTVDSLKELREQREQFENLKKIYLDLRDGKSKLEAIEKKTEEYEMQKRELEIREMMLCYQDFLLSQKEKEDIDSRLQILEQKKISLEQQKEDIQSLFEKARKRLQIAESNDAYRGMQGSIQNLESQIQDLKYQITREEEQAAKLLRLQMAFNGELSWMFEDWDDSSKNYLLHLAESGYSTEKKRESMVLFLKKAEELQSRIDEERVHVNDRIKELQTEIREHERLLKLLESNRQIFPKEIVHAKQVIKAELEKRGIVTDVRIFAELVQEVKDASWRKAIETFLGNKRFFIIVDGAYCHDAMKILQEKKIYTASVVLTDKLPDTEIRSGSAAEQLVIPNIFARRYANYMLNGIHLCESLEELHEYPKGGLMKDGMLAKSYAVSFMNINRTEICFGKDVIEEQTKNIQEKKRSVTEELVDMQQKYDAILNKQKGLRAIDLNPEHYMLESPKLLEEHKKHKWEYEETIRQIKDNPEFLAILQEQQDAKKAYDEVDAKRAKIISKEGSCQTEINTEKEQQKTIAGVIHLKKQRYDEIRMKHLELEQHMLSEYAKQQETRDEIRIITENQVQKNRDKVENCIRSLENEQWEYCKIAEIDINKRGVGYIPFYRQEYRNIANVKIEEAHARLEEQSKKLESAFMNDFVNEINGKIREAVEEIESINRELKQIPFGQDTYKFRMEPKADRMLFFRICKRLENYMDTPEVYMNSNRDDEEMERDIQEFMNMILEEEDEEEYTDYRKYFTYDMEITSRQGTQEITSDLSKKQGSASNGEKQTPYFIILAASLLQCYPRKSCCARLAFIDEAFSALSRERIEQMVKYLEENDFQVIYAAPPEKIGSIGQFIQSTVSLVVTGRYTSAVEGLIKSDAIYS